VEISRINVSLSYSSRKQIDQKVGKLIDRITGLAQDVPITAKKSDSEKQIKTYYRRKIEISDYRKSLICKVTDSRQAIPITKSNPYGYDDQPFSGTKEYIYENDALRELSDRVSWDIMIERGGGWNPP